MPCLSAHPLSVCFVIPANVANVATEAILDVFADIAQQYFRCRQSVTAAFLSEEDMRVHRSSFPNCMIASVASATVPLDAPPHVVESYRIFSWLERTEFNSVHFPLEGGGAYFSITAKRAGLAFNSTRFYVHSAMPRQKGNLMPFDSVDQLEVEYMEDQSAEMADTFFSATMDRVRSVKPMPYHLCRSSHKHESQIRLVEPRQYRRFVVFFAPLDMMHGLSLFCDAIDAIQAVLRDFTILFLGSNSRIRRTDAIAYIHARSRAWSMRVLVRTRWSKRGLAGFVGSNRALLVYPCVCPTTLEPLLLALKWDAPFVTTTLPDGVRMGLQIGRWSVTEPRVDELAACIRQAIVALNTGTSALKVYNIASLSPIAKRQHVKAPRNRRQLVTVCIAHKDRPNFLDAAVASIASQDYAPIELIIVDDASRTANAIAKLTELQQKFQSRGWSILRNTSERYPGACRNHAARVARGEYLLFMDDDNIAKANEVSTLMRAMGSLDADIVTCGMDIFNSQDNEASTPVTVRRRVFLGPSVSSGALRNCFGDTNALWRRAAFEAVGGFHEKWGVGAEDWELLARAVLAGFRLGSIPYALFWYRRHATQRIFRDRPGDSSSMVVLNTYASMIPPAMRSLVVFAKGASDRITSGPTLDIKS